MNDARTLRWASLLLAGLSVTGCAADDTDPPDNVTCDGVEKVADLSAMNEKLGSAAPGSCVVLHGGVTSSEPIVVPQGVVLTGSKGGGAIVVSDLDGEAGVKLQNDGELANISVSMAPRAGVMFEGPNGRLHDTIITGSGTAGVLVDLDGGAGDIQLSNVTLSKNGYGLFVNGPGARVSMLLSQVRESGGTALSTGVGVTVAGGASLTLEGVFIEDNTGAGVLVDGEKTHAAITACSISQNRERGIWAQDLTGSIEAPALSIVDSVVLRNRIVGIGAVASRGITMTAGRVADTVSASIPTDLSGADPVGDGFGIFEKSTNIRFDQTSFEANERAAGLIDGSENGNIDVSGAIAPGASGLKVVVQNSKASVQIPGENRSSTPKPLSVSSPRIRLPEKL